MELTFFDGLLTQALQRPVVLKRMTPLNEGLVSGAFHVGNKEENFLVKLSQASFAEDMFIKEQKGLNALKAVFGQVPEVHAIGAYESYHFMVMEFVERHLPSGEMWEDMGKRLAQLHRTTNDRFGWEEDNYIGTLPQKNNWHENWVQFFMHERIDPMLRKAIDNGWTDHTVVKGFERLFGRLDSMFANDPPSLLHGDFWSGNYHIGPGGKGWIYDPAVYYGNREMDIAMSMLFGGFDKKLYEVYHHYYPLHSGWKERVDICNLYPLLVHVNLFGGHYTMKVKEIVERFI